jgi:hypothetical protein
LIDLIVGALDGVCGAAAGGGLAGGSAGRVWALAAPARKSAAPAAAIEIIRMEFPSIGCG